VASGDQGEPLFGSRQAKLFLIFYAGILFAGLLSGSGFLVISRYLAFLLFMPFVLVSVRTHDDLRRVTYALALTFIVVFPYAVRQMIRYSNRLGTGVSETNYFAANLVLVIPIAFAVALAQSEPIKRRLWTAGGLTLVLALFLTSSRGGFLGLTVAGVAFAYRRRGIAGAVGLLAILVLAVLPTSMGDRMLATVMHTETHVAGLEQSNQAHSALFWAGLRMVADAPITGVGPQNFKPLSIKYAPELYRGFIAHNTYLELAAETGIPVLVLFLLLIWQCFRVLNRATRLRGGPEARELAMWAEGLRSGLTGFMVSAAFISAQYEKMFWVVVFVTIVVGRLVARHERRVAAEATMPEGGTLAPALAPAR
jgi:putative inorganic carbon (HCO3(-)) transporter